MAWQHNQALGSSEKELSSMNRCGGIPGHTVKCKNESPKEYVLYTPLHRRRKKVWESQYQCANLYERNTAGIKLIKQRRSVTCTGESKEEGSMQWEEAGVTFLWLSEPQWYLTLPSKSAWWTATVLVWLYHRELRSDLVWKYLLLSVMQY